MHIKYNNFFVLIVPNMNPNVDKEIVYVPFYICMCPLPVQAAAWWPGITNISTAMSATAVQCNCFYAYVTYK